MGKIVVTVLICLLLIFFAAPLVMIFTGKQMLASIIWSDFLDPMNMRVNPRDIILGQDKKSLSDLAKRLRAMSAQPDEAPLSRAVHIAIVDGLPKSRTTTKGAAASKIVVDLARAGNAAVLLVKSGAVVLRVENAANQRAKIGVEGGGPFWLENAPDGVLSGFRIDAFGSDAAALPRDYLENAGPNANAHFCDSIRQWAALYDVKLETMRIFVFREPGRIAVLPNGLGGSPEPKSSPTWTAGIECRDRSRDRFQRRNDNSDL